MYINLSGFNILVTGGSSGIGKAIVTKLAESGATVAIHYNTKAREAENLAGMLGNGCRAFQADLSNAAASARLFDNVLSEIGSCETLVNNAGAALSTKIEDPDEEWVSKWNETMAINLTAAAILSKKIINHLLKRKRGGRIINISSRAAFRGDTAEYLDYASSKAGLVALTRSIARAYGKNNIKAFNIAPGFVRTAMAKSFITQYGEEYAISDISLDRLTEPKDIAPMVTFLASGLADHATGSTIDINAGSYLH